MKFVALRKRKGYTQARLAEVAGVSAETISHIERGTVRSSHYPTIAKLAFALDTTTANVAAAIDASYAGRAAAKPP